MCKKLFIFCSLFIAAAASVILYSCKKEGSGDCGIMGGVVSPATYMFWRTQNVGCGNIKMQIKDANGNNVGMWTETITGYSATEPTCETSSFNKFGTVDVQPGKKYTYKASCTERSWSGEFTVPDCSHGKCFKIQLR